MNKEKSKKKRRILLGTPLSGKYYPSNLNIMKEENKVEFIANLIFKLLHISGVMIFLVAIGIIIFSIFYLIFMIINQLQIIL